MYRYMGPYYKFLVQTVEQTRVQFGCPVCKQTIFTSFCPKCGSPKVETESLIQKVEKVQPMKLVDELNIVDRFAVANVRIHRSTYDIWIPNQSIKGLERDIHFNDDDPSIQEFDQHAGYLIESEKEAFQAEYGKQIVKVAEAYEQSATVFWGLVSYFY